MVGAGGGRWHVTTWDRFEDEGVDMAQKARHGKVTLSNDQVQEVITRFNAGELGKDLAVEYGVARSTISRYVHGVRRDW